METLRVYRWFFLQADVEASDFEVHVRLLSNVPKQLAAAIWDDISFRGPAASV